MDYSMSIKSKQIKLLSQKTNRNYFNAIVNCPRQLRFIVQFFRYDYKFNDH